MFERSTLKGLALLGSVVAAVTGYGHLFSVEITETGVNLVGSGLFVGIACDVCVDGHKSEIPDCYQ
ncbi:hypothetical protein HYN93_09880 [Vibrio parahaemolyticus]|nr:hypothetical protein [Vibrio parahaemolyticus]